MKPALYSIKVINTSCFSQNTTSAVEISQWCNNECRKNQILVRTNFGFPKILMPRINRFKKLTDVSQYICYQEIKTFQALNLLKIVLENIRRRHRFLFRWRKKRVVSKVRHSWVRIKLIQGWIENEVIDCMFSFVHENETVNEMNDGRQRFSIYTLRDEYVARKDYDKNDNGCGFVEELKC